MVCLQPQTRKHIIAPTFLVRSSAATHSVVIKHVQACTRWGACRFMQSDEREEVLLRARKGLMKTSIETGAAVMPVYHLGNSRILKFGPSFLRGVSRKLRTSLGFIFGQYGLPIPIRHPIHMVVGKPILPGARHGSSCFGLAGSASLCLSECNRLCVDKQRFAPGSALWQPALCLMPL